jgi:hypothetical protein
MCNFSQYQSEKEYPRNKPPSVTKNMGNRVLEANSSREATENFHKTATSKLSEYGLPLFSEFDIYFYSTNKKTIRPEDVILHTLLIEPNNVRYTTYALLLLRKVKKQIDITYLQQEAERLGLKNQIASMLQFLATHIRPQGFK